MSEFDRVAWSEGMFLRPQHFQQQERFIKRESALLHENLRQYSWGVASLELDASLLKIGQFAITECVAVLPDRSIINIPERDLAPQPISVDKSINGMLVYLLIPHNKTRELNVADEESNAITRYRFHDHNLVDETDGQDEETVQLAKLNCSLKLTNEPVSGFHSIPVARVNSVTGEGEIVLDATFVPPSISVSGNPVLAKYLKDVIAMLQLRADAIASRMSQGKGNATSAADFMMLQVLNRYESTLKLLAQSEGVHPFDLCVQFYGLIGELSAFTAKNKRPPELPAYNHQELPQMFSAAFNVLNHCLSVVLEQTATRLPMEETQFGIRVSPIADKKMLASGQFVLAVKADIDTEEIRRRLPAQIKIGPVEHIRDLVNNQLQGIGVSPLPVAPRQIPYHAGFQYFELDKTNDYWSRLSASGGIALHLSGQYPSLEIELWSINQ
ncbi:type VI secretion system baseplate subunit TssK [Thaumasiovibrio subtropicus]|uniref:type VI secretion system baseplate subunit TssK n=1 Tax=Thaumasiovibrio subtropicus TaxID=1891207 RepID=UPI000B360A6D|nr:type VI secretion system baseplate subunit TssK [Thaumasiovibrio subtropicus]